MKYFDFGKTCLFKRRYVLYLYDAHVLEIRAIPEQLMPNVKDLLNLLSLK